MKNLAGTVMFRHFEPTKRKQTMDVETALAFNIISSVIDGNPKASDVEKAAKAVSSYAEVDGLTDEEIAQICDIICSGKLSGSVLVQLIRSLVPEYRVPEKVVEKILAWIFTKIGNLGFNVERLVFCWIADLLKYELCEKKAVQKYYYNFFFALTQFRRLEANAAAILCYTSQSCDAKAFIINSLIARHQRGTFSQLNSLLAILKGFRSDLVPISLGKCPLERPASSYDSGFLNAGKRINARTRLEEQRFSLACQRTINPTQGILKKKPRLIPAVEYARQRTSIIVHPVALDNYRITITIPAQMMSLLANEGGFLTLFAAEPARQARLLYNLEETLNKVFLLETEAYSNEEKSFLLVSMAALQEFLNYSLSFVSKFLIKYLLMWDGYDFAKYVHSLIGWLTFDSMDEWKLSESVFRALFRTCDACTLLLSLKKMLRNMVIASLARRADIPPPIYDYRHDRAVIDEIYTAVTNMIGESLSERLTHSSSQKIAAHSLYFYQEATIMEEEGDLSAFTMVPQTIVYNVLLSNHRSNIHNLIGILLQYDKQRERLRRLGDYEQHEERLNIYLGTYLMDTYRALIAHLGYKTDLHEGAFSEEFLNLTGSLKPGEALNIKNPSNITWWFPADSSASLKHYSNINALRKFIESKLAELVQ